MKFSWKKFRTYCPCFKAFRCNVQQRIHTNEGKRTTPLICLHQPTSPYFWYRLPPTQISYLYHAHWSCTHLALTAIARYCDCYYNMFFTMLKLVFSTKSAIADGIEILRRRSPRWVRRFFPRWLKDTIID